MGIRKLSKQLLAKSEESFLLGLEIFNKPTISYRIEAFAFFFTNAWELLMKAHLIEQAKETKVIFLKKEPKKERKSITFDMCLGRIFTTPSDPVRQNLVDISDLRNHATHLIIPELETIYTGLFQRGVLHYLEFYKFWFDKSPAITPRMLTLVFDFDPGEVSKITIRTKYGKEVSTFFETAQKHVVDNIQHFGPDYSVLINSKLALVKNPKKADLVLNPGVGTSASGTIIEVPKDPAKTHPLLIDKVAAQIKEHCKAEKFGRYEIIAIRQMEQIDEVTRPDLIYKDKVHKSTSPQYSSKFVEFVCSKVKGNKKYLEKTIHNYKAFMAAKSTKKR